MSNSGNNKSMGIAIMDIGVSRREKICQAKERCSSGCGQRMCEDECGDSGMKVECSVLVQSMARPQALPVSAGCHF